MPRLDAAATDTTATDTATVKPTARYIALAGPTASGKTAAALAIAAHLKNRIPVEIISADSALVYRGMDIGTAKPSQEELAAVPHHLIDIRDPLQAYSAAEFAKDAGKLITEISARGHLPLLVGGTMLYFKALWHGLDDMPSANPDIRAALELEAAAVGWPAMHTQLAQIDTVSAARLQPNDAQRIQRALEVYRISGKPLSSFQSALTGTKQFKSHAIHFAAPNGIYQASTSQNSTINPLFITLEPRERAWLHLRISQRFDSMLTHGFEQEVRRLRSRGDLTADTPAMRCVGYRQMWEALNATQNGALEEKTLQDMRDKGIAATRQLCKRQLTWLRSMSQRQVIACDAPDVTKDVLARVDTWLQAVR